MESGEFRIGLLHHLSLLTQSALPHRKHHNNKNYGGPKGPMVHSHRGLKDVEVKKQLDLLTHGMRHGGNLNQH